MIIETVEELIEQIQKNTPEVYLQGVEYKESWTTDSGKDISAIANEPTISHGWLVIGVSDNGKLVGRDSKWLKKTELDASGHIRDYLSPSWAIKGIKGHSEGQGSCLIIEIQNEGDIVRWKEKAYKLIGTTSSEMHPAELLERSLQLPGADVSKAKYTDKIDPSLVTEFGKKLLEQSSSDFDFDLSKTSSQTILTKLNIFETNTSGILFGSYPFRLVHFDENGDILDQIQKEGLFRLLSDGFVEEIQSWTRTKGTVIKGLSTVATEEEPYPRKAIREVLGNAVAHALYPKNSGDIVVELHPSRMTVRNNCRKEAKAFTAKWFSRTYFVSNKHLMNTLRVARITDEQGSGKIRVFRHMIEAGKREPVIEFDEFPDYARWSTTLYNDESNAPLQVLADRIKDKFPSPDHRRIATALLLWRKKPWTQIKQYLDNHYLQVAEEVLDSRDSPVIKVDDFIFTKRWAEIALTGQVSKRFSAGEENEILHFLRIYTLRPPRDGHITAEEARHLMGLSNEKSEMTQLSNLFRKWKVDGHVKMIKKGSWQFLAK